MLTLDYLSKPVSTDELVAALERQGVLTPGGGQNGSQEPDPLLDAQASKCFLVVDDEPDILVTLARLLQSRIPNSRVLKASNGEQALDLMMKSRPDLVLLDLMMPEMSGFEVIENMRQHPDLCDIPVMVLTAKTLTEDVMAQLDEGVATMLSKGLFSADETLRHVDLALRRSHQANLGVRRMVRSAMAYIHEHYMESMTRQDIAEHVGYSPRHLDRCFDEEMELTPMAYLNRFRLRQSRRLLESTSRDIGEIASAVGFSDSAYFSRVFKQETGMSPTEYRKTL
jgi:YesN/AraC family two-component response regulator